MRVQFGVAAMLLASTALAWADRSVASGYPLILSNLYSTNPDCTSSGKIVVRVTRSPEHGKVTVRDAGVFPNFPESNIRSACNRRRVPGVQVIYVSQRGYTGPDFVGLQVNFPMGREATGRFPIQVK